MGSGLTARLDAHLDRVTRAGASSEHRRCSCADAASTTASAIRHALPRREHRQGRDRGAGHAAGRVGCVRARHPAVESRCPAAELDGLVRPDGDRRISPAPQSSNCSPTPRASPTTSTAPCTGPTFLRLVLDEPDRPWTPAELLEFSRHRQRPVAAPGERFAYSDTGYILLGRILEEATGRRSTSCCTNASSPLGMRHSWLVSRSQPDDPRDPDSRRSGSARSRRAGSRASVATGRAAASSRRPTTSRVQRRPCTRSTIGPDRSRTSRPCAIGSVPASTTAPG